MLRDVVVTMGPLDLHDLVNRLSEAFRVHEPAAEVADLHCAVEDAARHGYHFTFDFSGREPGVGRNRWVSCAKGCSHVVERPVLAQDSGQDFALRHRPRVIGKGARSAAPITATGSSAISGGSSLNP